MQNAKRRHAPLAAKSFGRFDVGENNADVAVLTFTWNGDDEPAATVMLEGVAEQLPPTGNPVHASETEPENPLDEPLGYEAML